MGPCEAAETARIMFSDPVDAVDRGSSVFAARGGGVEIEIEAGETKSEKVAVGNHSRGGPSRKCSKRFGYDAIVTPVSR